MSSFVFMRSVKGSCTSTFLFLLISLLMPSGGLAYVFDNPETTDQLVKKFVDAKQQIISEDKLKSVAADLKNNADLVGDNADSEALSFQMMGQWLYLEIYRVRRTEYLMQSLFKAIGLCDRIDAMQAEGLFARLIPEESVRHYPQLARQREAYVEQIRGHFADPKNRQELRLFLQGNLEAAYLGLAVLDSKRNYLEESFDESDERYKNGIEEIEAQKRMVLASNSILLTKAFKNHVEPHYEEEVREAATIQQRAALTFNRDFQKFSEQHGKISDIVDYATGDEMQTLAKAFAESLDVKIQGKFRSRVAAQLNHGIKEILDNLDETLTEHWQSVFVYDTVSAIVVENMRPKTAGEDFRKWLISVFREQAVHWTITEDFGFLQTSADSLTQFVSQQTRKHNIEMTKRYIAMGLLIGLTPAVGVKHGGWLGKSLLAVLRGGFIAGELYLGYQLLYDAVHKYSEWRNIQRLARLSTEAPGLTTLVQEESMFWSMMTSFTVAGFSLGSAALINSKVLSNKALTEGKPNFLGDVVKATWSDGIQFSFADIRGHLRHSLKDLGRHLRAGQFAASKASIGNVMEALGIFGSQFVMLPALALPSAMRSFISRIPLQVYQGVSLGTVMAIMGVTFQHYITAGGLKLFTYSFEKLGFNPPTVWKANELNAEFKTKRDIYLRAMHDYTYSRAEISRLVGHIAMWEQALESENLPPSRRKSLLLAIKGAKTSIQQLLELNLVKWYKAPESQDIYLSVMQEMGFHLIVENPEMPDRMTIRLYLGDEVFSYSTKASLVESVIDRKVDFNQLEEGDEIDRLVSLLGEDEDDGQDVKLFSSPFPVIPEQRLAE